MTEQHPQSDPGPPDWSFDLTVDRVPDVVGQIAFDMASGAMVVFKQSSTGLSP